MSIVDYEIDNVNQWREKLTLTLKYLKRLTSYLKLEVFIFEFFVLKFFILEIFRGRINKDIELSERFQLKYTAVNLLFFCWHQQLDHEDDISGNDFLRFI